MPAKEGKMYRYFAVSITRSNQGEPTSTMLQEMNQLGHAGYRFVGIVTLPSVAVSEQFVLMEQEEVGMR
jgi:hypothetical protein